MNYRSLRHRGGWSILTQAEQRGPGVYCKEKPPPWQARGWATWDSLLGYDSPLLREPGSAGRPLGVDDDSRVAMFQPRMESFINGEYKPPSRRERVTDANGPVNESIWYINASYQATA